MAQYNADIRIGVTGKASLNQLEAQLKRTQLQLNKLNKSLQLRTRVQAIRLDTRAANTAIKQLEQRINRLGRTINVNLRVNEKEGRKSQSGGGSVLAVNNPAKQLAVAKASAPIAKALTNEAQALLDAEEARAKAINKLTENKRKEVQAQQDLNKAFERQRKLQQSTDNRTAANFYGKGTTRESGLKQVQKEINSAQSALRGLAGVQTRFKTEVAATSREYGELRAEIQRSEQAADKAAKKAAQKATNRKTFNKGLGTGFGVGAASAVGNIPVVSQAATGGLVASLSGGSVVGGAIGGAVAGLGAVVVGVTADVTAFNNELSLMRKALANTVNTSDELETSLSAIRGISQDFLVPIGQATKEFTKLNAAARASGFTVEEVEEVYRGLASANVALGGDSERLQGILLATQQVFSKGKVQAEELRGQIGERLAGAFAKFAESAGLSTSQLDKALEKGEVSLQDFVRFAKSMLDEYEEDAKRLADEPENAAKRLKLAMDDLREAMGPIATDIGNYFIEMANTIVTQLARAFNFINQFRLEGQKNLVSQTRKNVGDTASRLSNMRRNAGTGFGQASPEEIKEQEKLLATQIEQREKATKELRRLQGLMNPTGKPLKDKDPPTDRDRDKSKRSKGSKGSEPRDTVAQTQVALQLERAMLEIEQKRYDLIGQSNQLKDFDLQRTERKKQLESELQLIEQSNITAASKLAEKELARAQYATDLQRIKNDERQTQVDLNKTFEEQEAALLKAIELESAITDEMRRQIELKYDLADIQDGPLNDKQKDRLKALRSQLEAKRGENANKVKQYMDQLKIELNDVDGMIVSLASTIETELSSAMSTAIVGLIEGTQTAEEAFSNMFSNIGKAFIDMATQMIAQALIMRALGILMPGGASAGGGFGGGYFNSTTGLGAAGPNFGLAEGGYVTGPTQATVGEGGSNEYVIPESKMGSAMQRWNAGMRGDSVIDGADPTSAAGSAQAEVPTSINITGGVMQFGGEDFIRKDQLPSIISQAGKQGEQRALRKLQMSSSTRRRVGL